MSERGEKGMPGPCCASTELGLLSHLICELERAGRDGILTFGADGTNPTVPVDVFLVRQAEKALKNYEALLRQTLYQLIPPGFFNAKRPQYTGSVAAFSHCTEGEPGDQGLSGRR